MPGLRRKDPRLRLLVAPRIHLRRVVRAFSSCRWLCWQARPLESCNRRAADAETLALPADKATFRDCLQGRGEPSCFGHRRVFEAQLYPDPRRAKILRMQVSRQKTADLQN